MTIPNLITAFRIILAPIFVIYLLQDRFMPALVVFVLAGLSDAADGLIARVFNQKSRLGSYLDPLADKILLVAAFLTLAVRGFVPPWLTVLAISRDVLILLGTLILSLSGVAFAIRPSIVSKLTTFFQLLTIFLILSQNQFHFSPQFAESAFFVTGALTIASGLHYMYFWFRTMGEHPDSGG
jgi:cardiolipin synthase